jgi:hypothetical protein
VALGGVGYFAVFTGAHGKEEGADQQLAGWLMALSRVVCWMEVSSQRTWDVMAFCDFLAGLVLK